MRLTSEADYALRIMRCLAQKVRDDGCGGDCSANCRSTDCTGKLDAAAIALCVGVPQRFTVKILNKLIRGGLIKSYKGAAGGYTLARNADTITTLQILELIDGPMRITRCPECTPCPAGGADCAFHRLLTELNSDMRSRLDAFRLSDALGDPKTQQSQK